MSLVKNLRKEGFSMQRWNIEYLKQLHTKYQRLAAITEDPTLSLEYRDTANSVLDVIDRYDVLVHKKSGLTGANEVVTHKSIISSDFSILSDYGHYCPYIRNLAEYHNLLEIKPNPDATYIEFSLDKVVSLCSRFYSQFDSFFADVFNNIFDTHSHYDDDKFDNDRFALLNSIKDKGVANIVSCGCDIKTTQFNQLLAQKFDFLYYSAGFHPECLEGFTLDDVEKLAEFANDEKCVAIGEIGLDYHWMSSPKQVQIEFFEKHRKHTNNNNMYRRYKYKKHRNK